MSRSARRRRDRRALELFDAACDLPAGERLGFLDHACGADDELRAQVHAMLAVHASTGELVGGLAAAAREIVSPSDPQLAAAELTAAVVQTNLGLDRYEIVGILGEGGMGTVFRARDRQLHREVALKVIRDSATPARVARFEDEARVMAALVHPNIVAIHDFGPTAAGKLFYTMHLLNGGNLEEVLDGLHKGDPGSRLDEPDRSSLRGLVQVLAKAMAGVEYAHERGIVHRDLKPSNIVLGAAGEVQVVDWGISKALAGSEKASDHTALFASGSVTRTGEVLGTLAYMSPEQARGEPTSSKSDVYSLGAILYQLLTLTVPFMERDPKLLLQAIQYTAPQPPRLRAPSRHIPEALESLCLAALKKAPEDRPSIEQMVGQVRSWLDGATGAEADADAGDRSGDEPKIMAADSQVRKPQARPWKQVGAAVVAIIAVIAIAVLTRGHWQPPFDGPVPEMTLIPAGTFEMGSPAQVEDRFSDEFRRTVTISQPFQLAKTEVTREQFQAVMSASPSTDELCGPTCPVTDVSWVEAITYCNRLSALMKLEPCYRVDDTSVTWPERHRCTGFRLPTEAEWEYAARAGHSTRFSGTDSREEVCKYGNVADATWFGNTPDPEAFTCDDGHHGPAAVAQFLPNDWGLFDMTGNVLEWVWDWKATPPRDPTIDPVGPERGISRVVHGGSYRTFYRYQRLSARHDEPPGNRTNAVGFRVARSKMTAE